MSNDAPLLCRRRLWFSSSSSFFSKNCRFSLDDDRGGLIFISATVVLLNNLMVCQLVYCRVLFRLLSRNSRNNIFRIVSKMATCYQQCQTTEETSWGHGSRVTLLCSRSVNDSNQSHIQVYLGKLKRIVCRRNSLKNLGFVPTIVSNQREHHNTFNLENTYCTYGTLPSP